MRQAKGLRSIDLAQMTGLTKGFISKLENGHALPSPDTLRRLAKALNVPSAMIERRITDERAC